MTEEFEKLLKERAYLSYQIKHLQEALQQTEKQIRATCKCEEREGKSHYSPGDYYDPSLTTYWDECIHCKERYNVRFKRGGYA